MRSWSQLKKKLEVNSKKLFTFYFICCIIYYMNLKIFTDLIEEKATGHIYQLLEQPAFKDAKVRIMPDVHAGAGCVIGFTADLGDKVLPNIVGVDIGCGMHVVKLGRSY